MERTRERTRADGDEFRRLKEQRLNGKVVVRGDELPWIQSAQARAKFFSRVSDWDKLAAPGWMSFIHDIRQQSGKHRHQGGTPLFVLEGTGYTVVNERRHDWEAGDLIILPVQAGGCSHQHFNTSPSGTAKWVSLIYQYAKITPLGNEAVQQEVSPDWVATEEEKANAIGTVDPVDEARLKVQEQQRQAGASKRETDTILGRLLTQRDRERERLLTARMVIKGKDIKPELNPMGIFSWYLHPFLEDAGTRASLVYVQEIPPGSRSGKQLHQGGRLHYVMQGRGHTIVDGVRHDWQEGDEIFLTIKYDGVIHQHFNDSRSESVKLLCAEPNWFDMFGVDLGSGLEIIEPCPEYVSIDTAAR